MRRLILKVWQGDSNSERHFQFDPDRRHFILLGSGEECQVRLEEPQVSLEHAIIMQGGGQYHLYDQSGVSGTYVNGVRADGALLGPGDVIELGPGGPRLLVELEELARAQREPTPQQLIRETADKIGLYDPVHDSGRATKWVELGFLFMIFAVFGLAVLSLIGLHLGLAVALISSGIALVTALFYLGIFLWLDRFDPEPPMTLAVAFAWGATVAVFFSGVINDLSGLAIGDHLAGIVFAPMIEEAWKGIGVILIAVFFRKDFDSIVDGIVYAGVVALGFAAMENIDYYGRSLVNGGMGSLVGTFFVRGVMAPFSHVLFTCMTGIGCGITRESNRLNLKIAAPLIGYLGAMLLHGIWNTLASYDGGTFFAGYLVLEVPLFISLICLISYLVKREGRILKQTLAVEVERGLITQQQLEITISVFRRTGWVASAFGQSRLFNRRRQFLRAVAKLGLCHWHRKRAMQVGRETGSLSLIAQLQAEVFMLRDQV
ncbi:MAG TPA: PrsW family glutamic-type intramembrane protease [Blastocatellia bacterium]|nr:PrsW family glutamic-type intramembrane protease [Blastocatellia bacterium]